MPLWEAAGFPYFVTGSFASSAHGVPRSTNDIDIVIAPTRGQLERLLDELQRSEFATDLEEDPFDAFERAALFNIVDEAMLWKIDFIFNSALSHFGRIFGEDLTTSFEAFSKEIDQVVVSAIAAGR